MWVRRLCFSLVRVPVWVCVRGVGVVVDCLIVRVDDDCVVVSPVWGRGGLPGLWGRGLWACFGLSAILFFVESLILAQDERWRRA